MSLLLDALKQSQNPGAQLPGEGLEQQQALRFYRRLTWSLLLVVIVLITLAIGYFVGKQWQLHTQPQEHPSKQAKAATASPAQRSDATEQAPTTATDSEANVATSPGQVNMQALQMPGQVNPYQQMVPVYVMPQMTQPYSAPGAYMHWVPTQANTAMQMQPHYQANMNTQAANQGQYRVVGQPMAQTHAYPQSKQMNNGYNNGLSNQSDSGAERTYEQQNDAQLAGVSDDLKRAFADAVAATENMETDDSVTTASRASSMADPIELLPETIQNRIPKLVYQAHIYATEQSKRWIKINGYELYEGDSVGRLRVVEITPEQSILSIDNYEFSLEAMQDWP